MGDGSAGGAAAAVAAWRRGEQAPPEARQAFATPKPRIPEALWLAERRIPRAMLDLSDGLAGDLAHLAAASGVAIVIQAAQVPISAAAHALDLALAGGEDYEICFAARSDSVEPHLATFQDRFNLPLTRIGSVIAGSGVFLDSGDGRPTQLTGGFEHFGGQV